MGMGHGAWGMGHGAISLHLIAHCPLPIAIFKDILYQL